MFVPVSCRCDLFDVSVVVTFVSVPCRCVYRCDVFVFVPCRCYVFVSVPCRCDVFVSIPCRCDVFVSVPGRCDMFVSVPCRCDVCICICRCVVVSVPFFYDVFVSVPYPCVWPWRWGSGLKRTPRTQKVNCSNLNSVTVGVAR